VQNLSSQHLARLYDEFADTEVTFNAQVILESGLVTSDVRLTLGSRHLDCVLYASSMKHARVIVEMGHAEAELHGSSAASLHFTFRQPEEKAAVSFFVGCRIDSLSEYNPQKTRLRFAALEFTQRAPDALIAILGSLLEIKSNALRRRDQRIVMTADAMKRLGIQSRESCVAIDGTSRRCLLRDLSFGGAKVLLSTDGLPASPQRVLLKLHRCEDPDDTVLNGSVVRVEDVQGHEDLVALSIRYSSDPPISYKQKINSVFAQF